MERGEELQRIRNRMTRTEFVRTYDHLWLIRELGSGEQSSGYHTKSVNRHRNTQRDQTPSSASLTGLSREPNRYACCPLVKAGSNPWSDRVTVGRATNNDIVLWHSSISKLHGWFQRGSDGVLKLYDARSKNGTRIGSALVPADGVEVTSGMLLMFGSMLCELVDSDRLYEALGGVV
jgi:hypothetical protein